MSSSYTVSLRGPAPWGFRLQGGKDFCMPLTISKLTDGGKAALANMEVGDVVLSIDGVATSGMTHLEAQNKIKACTGNLSLTLQKASSSPKPASTAKEEPLEVIKPVPISQPAPPTVSSNPATTSAYNKTARPFGGGASAGSPAAPKVASIPSATSAFIPAAPTQVQQPAPPLQPAPPPQAKPAQPSQPQPPFPIGGTAPRPITSLSSSHKPSSVRSPVPASSSPAKAAASSSAPVPPQPSVYNTPFNLYSSENACEVAVGQRRGLLEKQGGAEQLNGAPWKPPVDVCVAPPHSQAVCDPSKKRLVEDPDNWQPRTGASQSRSFRMLAQMTGTEHEQDMGNKEAMDNNVVEAQPIAHHLPAAKVMTKAPAGATRSSTAGPTQGFKAPSAQSKPATWQAGSSPAGPKAVTQKAQATASFGRVSSSSPRGPASDRPAPQPHPKDQDTVVQRAEHIPAGTRTPMCANCDNVIRGPFLVAMGKSWHPEEFNCVHCHTSLAEMGFVEERGSVYCAHCYEEFFAPMCTRCQHKILGEVINALKQTWHVHCFVCASCQQPIRNNTFHLEDGQPYCETDYYSIFGTICHGCDFPIEAGDKFLEALGFTWHDTCFVCTVCSTSLEGQAFFSKKDKPLCKKHANTVKI